MAKNIRSQYIKNLLADKETLSEELKKNTKDSLKAILEETVKDSLRDILNEEDEKEKDEESFEVEEVGTEEPEEAESESEISVEDTVDEPETDEESDETGEDVEEVDLTDETPDTEDTGDDEMWDELDKFKGENGEYDLTGMADDEVIKVLKVMKPEDAVRVVKNDNGTITLTDDNCETEYVIDLDGEYDEEDELMNEEDLGYTDNYQNKTAMTTPGNHETGKNVRDLDKGVPHGTEKPWVGKKGNMSPFNKEVNECNNECNNECGDGQLYEIEIDDDMEESTTIGNGSHTVGVVGDTNQSVENGQRKPHKANPLKVNEDKRMNNMLRKANAILNENKELRKIAADLKQKINEAVVINSSLAKVINLVTENSTTRNEKIDILKRFNNVKTLEESRSLYETISNELKSTHAVNNGTKLINEQIGQEKPRLTETEMYKSDDLNETKKFMERLNKIK